MQQFEYKVVPAPKRGEKHRGLKTTGERFAQTLTDMMNALGRDGWDYVRADTLPCEERAGLTGTRSTFQNMLVFRRVLHAPAASTEAAAAAAQPVALLAEPPVVYAPTAPVVNPPANGSAPALGPATGSLTGPTRPGFAAE